VFKFRLEILKRSDELEDRRHVFGEPPWIGFLGEHLSFEFRSLFFRRLIGWKKRKPRKSLLHLGSANHLLHGFENVDFYDYKIMAKKFLGKIDKDIKYVGHDLRYRLPFPNSSFEGAFCEHTLEHLHPFDAKAFLKDVKRVLKPGSIFRVVVPDLDLYLDFCGGKIPNEKFQKFNSPASAVWSLTQNFGHRSVWNFTQLEAELLQAGFESVRKEAYSSGSDSRLLHDLPRRAWESLYVECRS